MDWGNAIVRSKTNGPSGTIISMVMDLNLAGDFRKTKKKVTWLAQPPAAPLVDVTLLDYDYLITKKKLEEGDDVKDFVTPVTEFRENAVADGNVRVLKKGDILQFERKGYFIYDGEVEGKMEFIRIPDGRAAGLASKVGKIAPTISPATDPGTLNDTSPRMYEVEKLYGGPVVKPAPTMYPVPNIYDA